jgi:hypothetical protein
MSSHKNHFGIILLLRWAARLLSLASIGILAMFILGDVPLPGRVAARDWVGLTFFPLGVMVGMIVGWRREGLGAAIGLLSLAFFYGIYGQWLRGSAASLGWWFLVFSSPLLLFLLTWIVSRVWEQGASGGAGSATRPQTAAG